MKLKLIMIIILFFLVMHCRNKDDQGITQVSEEYLKNLLLIAKKGIINHLEFPEQKHLKDIEYSNIEKGLCLRILKNNNDRGCYSFIKGVFSDEEAVKILSINAAFFDDRFHPVSNNELNQISLEVSTFGKFIKMKNYKDFAAGVDSVFIRYYGSHAFLQAPVIYDVSKSKKRFMEIICKKAGLDKGFYKNNKADLYKSETISLRKKFSDIGK